MTPTKEIYAELQQAYDFFNQELFGGKLPDCIITFYRKKWVHGYFAKEQWANHKGEVIDEIAMNPMYFNIHTTKKILSTLVHEMAHLYQKHFGHPARGYYHNQEWADIMESIGLMPSDTGGPGGKRTGNRMSHYIIKGGAFDKAQAKLAAKDYSISWFDRIAPF